MKLYEFFIILFLIGCIIFHETFLRYNKKNNNTGTMLFEARASGFCAGMLWVYLAFIIFI